MIYLPNYTWDIIKAFLLRKKHPTALLIKKYTFYYTKPQIFLSYYYQLRNGMFVKMDKPCLQCIPEGVLERSISFAQYVRSKKMTRSKSPI
jgi:hypothetical protein